MCLVERIDLTPANADVRHAGLDLLTRMVADHEAADTAAGRPDRPRRDVLADKAYTSETRKAEDWIWPLWELGFTSVHDLTTHQLGPARRGTPKPASGALVIDGQPYSPRLPNHLRNLTPPALGANRAAIAQRAVYALHAVGGRNEDGSWDFGCRAMKLLGQLRCDLKPRSMTLPLTKPTSTATVFTPVAGRLPKVCGQEKARITRDELPYWQPDAYGSRAWYDSFNRRNRIEGIFGNLKNDAARTTDGHQPAPVARRPRRRTVLIEATRPHHGSSDRTDHAEQVSHRPDRAAQQSPNVTQLHTRHHHLRPVRLHAGRARPMPAHRPSRRALRRTPGPRTAEDATTTKRPPPVRWRPLPLPFPGG